MPDTPPRPVLEVDLDDDGVFETDISIYVYEVATGWGRRSPLEKVGPRTAKIVLDNTDSRFTPKETSSPYSPNWTKDKPIRLKAVVPTPAVTNLIENPSLETDILGWETGGGAPTRIITAARYGRACGQVEGTAGSDTIVITNRDLSRIPVTASLSYVFKVWHRSVDDSSLHQMRINWYDSGGSLLTFSVVNWTATPGEAWTEESVVATAPGTAVTAELQLSDIGQTAGETLLYDGAMFYQGSDATVPYLDGDQPGATWSGTAHESTSSRGADPTFAEIIGFISNIRVERRHGDYICTVDIASRRDYQLDQYVSQHNIIDRKTEHSFNRLLDLLEGTELFKNPSFEERINGTTLPAEYSKVGTPPATLAIIEATASFQLDGKYVLGVTGTIFAAGDGWRYDMTPVTSGDKTYRFVLFLANEAGANGGKQVAFRMIDDLGGEAVQASTLYTLPGSITDLGYIIVEGTYRAGSTARYVEVVANEAFAAGGGWRTDAHHGCLAADKIPRSYLGLAAATLKHVAAFFRSARSLIDELADSVGGIIWDAGDGTFTLEDYQTRSATPVPKTRLTDSLELDGMGVSGIVYGELQDHAYTEVLVFSDGDIVASSPSEQDVWTLDPNPTLGNNEVRVYYVAYATSETGGQLIAEKENITVTVSSGSVTTDLKPYGVGALLTVTAGASGAVITLLKIVGPIFQRQSNRSRVAYTPVGASDRRFQRQLRLDMPMQGDATAAMTAVAQQAGDNFLEGQDTIEATFAAMTTEQWLEALGRTLGDSVHVRHNTGPGHLALDAVYQIEGRQLKWTARPQLSLEVTWTLSRASIQLITTRRAAAENAEARQFVRAAAARRQPL